MGSISSKTIMVRDDEFRGRSFSKAMSRREIGVEGT